MRICVIIALVGPVNLAFAQTIDLAYVDAQPVATPTLILYQKEQIVEYNQATAISEMVAAVSATPIPYPEQEHLKTRDSLHRRDDPAVVTQVLLPACQDLEGTLYDVPDDTVTDRVAKFLNDTDLQDQAINAASPLGYTQVFQNIQNSSQAHGYMG